MKSSDEQFLTFSAIMVLAALIAAPFTGGLSLLGVGLGLLALWHFTRKLS